jgi:hypothetical protein
MCAHQYARQRDGADDGEKPHGGAPIEGIHFSASADGIPLQARNASRKSPRQSPRGQPPALKSGRYKSKKQGDIGGAWSML